MKIYPPPPLPILGTQKTRVFKASKEYNPKENKGYPNARFVDLTVETKFMEYLKRI